jgi:hypothetical protein
MSAKKRNDYKRDKEPDQLLAGLSGESIDEPMNVQSAWETITFRGDSVEPADGHHELRLLVAEVVARLPRDVQDWLVGETNHVFIGGNGQLGEYFPHDLFPMVANERTGETTEGSIYWSIRLRVIFLSEQLASVPKSEALWTIAHEIAHSRLNHMRGGFDEELEADRLVQEWGFTEPKGRAAERKKLYGPPAKRRSAARPSKAP